jgi:hypothetical protein
MDLRACARDVLDGVRYVALGTVDEDGRPRVSPVYFVHRGYADLYWVSDPGSHHSANLHRDPRLSGVVFDSSVPPGPDGDADLRLWVLHVDRCEVHIRGGHPTLGTGTDRRIPVQPWPPETLEG